MSAASLTRYHLRFIEQQHAGDPRWSDWEISAPETSPFLGIHAGEEPRCCSAFGIMNPGISADAKRRMLDDFYVKRDAMMAKLAPTLRAAQRIAAQRTISRTPDQRAAMQRMQQQSQAPTP